VCVWSIGQKEVMANEIVVSKLPEKSRGSLSLAFKLLNIG